MNLNLNFIDGYKTIIAATLMILTGLASMLGVGLPEQMAISGTGWEMVVAGFGLLGIGGKLDKSRKK